MKKINTLFGLILLLVIIGTSNTTFAQKRSNNSGSDYSTSFGVRGGFTSGLSLKHFISNKAALEGVLGTRWQGFNFTGLYELHSRNAIGVPNLSWEYGLGGRIGFYDGAYYRSWKDKQYYANTSYTVVSLVGIFGLEYSFDEIPFTLGVDLIPYFDVLSRGDNWIDGSLAFRYKF